MRIYNITCLIDQEEKITFRADKVEIEERGNSLFCSLDGEFLKNRNPFEPPVRYQMNNIGVTTRNLVDILTPIYHSLKQEGNL